MKYRLFGVGTKGKAPMVTAQHRINCYIEEVLDEDESTTALIASPGMDLFSSDLGSNPVRGWIVVDGVLYLASSSTFYSVSGSGAVTSRGTLSTTTGRVDMVSDGVDTIMILDGTAGYTYTISTVTLAAISDSDFPDTAPTGAWHDGYYIAFGPSDTFQISEDGAAWDALDIASGNVGTIVRGIEDHGELVIFGEKKMTFWSNTGDADFPYRPLRGSDTEVGLAARWSVAKCDDSPFFLGKNAGGQRQIYRLNGHTPAVVSTPELDSIINRYGTVALANAAGYAFMHEGHYFYRISFPVVDKTWEYDALASARTGKPVWCERQSGVAGERHRGEMSTEYQNKILVADYEDGNIYAVNAATYTENGTQYPFEIVSRRLAGDDAIEVNRLVLEFEAGVGLVSGQGSDPQVMLQCSRDGGHTWGNEQWKSFGEMGQYGVRPEWHQFGTADSFVFKMRVTDPVKRILVNAAIID